MVFVVYDLIYCFHRRKVLPESEHSMCYWLIIRHWLSDAPLHNGLVNKEEKLNENAKCPLLVCSEEK